MSQPGRGVFTEITRRYIKPGPLVTASRVNILRWAMTIPFRSYIGGKAISRYVGDDRPAVWAQEMAGKRVLIVGSGPSLDKVDAEFFDGFDALIYINFALRRMRGTGSEYFFTTDIGPVREFLDTHGAAAFHTLGKDHCIFAPVFFDQYQMMTERGRELFSWIGFDAAYWRFQKLQVGPFKLPLVLRYYPIQPDWAAFHLPRSGRRIPVIDHTSALTAILFAATNGAVKIGMIGCDFSAGRANSVASSQAVPAQGTFGRAAAEFHAIKDALAPQGAEVTNHSWTV